jgi:propionyl-CoA carboxylase alpha chain
MLEKILIANRGEIACRIIRTCRRMGIRTVAVFSEADAEALHVRMADEAVAIGPAAARESYLAIERIVAAAKATGADAVHPGYGFLAENPGLARALAVEGIAFIGPPEAAIRAMGDKLESKRIAREAGVHTVPGHPDAIATEAEALAVARGLGFPLMIKAAAGGGGKGMRVARERGELIQGLERARSEARSAFGDDRVLLERYIDSPRHIEIQVLADAHGNVVHLFERECSVQRRHQKVIEEAPSPFLDSATRAAMGADAVRLARAVGYVSAGTVEFVVDRERRFYFLEMNTRLQVEHPVTELVTGLDLVEWMIRIARGEPLPFGQDDLAIRGAAIEARVYAEDPARGFLPSTGRLRRYLEPEGEGIRVDSGVREGDEVSLFYDPMIAKACAHGHDRETARRRLAAALDAFVIEGPTDNLAFLGAVLDHPRFRAGDLSTGFVAETYGERFDCALPDAEAAARLAAMAVAMRLIQDERAARVSGRLQGWRWRPERAWCVRLGAQEVQVEAEIESTGSIAATIDGRPLSVVVGWRPGQALVRCTVDGIPFTAQATPFPEGWLLRHGGTLVPALVRSRRAADLARRIPARPPPAARRRLVSPMPGLLVKVAVAPGDAVKAGQELLVLEAMKMENVLRAEHDAVIAEILVAPADAVQADQVLITFA